MYLRLSKEAHDAVGSLKRSERIVKQKEKGFKEVRIKEVAKIGNRRVESGTE